MPGLTSFEARYARTSSDERNCAHAGMTAKPLRGDGGFRMLLKI
jgi:hypothetical protein